MKQFLSKLGARISVLPVLFAPTAAHAQLDQQNLGGLEGVGQELQGGSTPTDLPTFVGQMINAVLGVLGIILVVLIVYAGFLYMTAGGESDRVDKAKKILINSVIGLVIILAAYAIANFVITTLTGATS